ncbi:MAG: ATP phosphoribosyltransferase [Bacteroidales bacterium]|jgi:ATP phosphoribosyltransferase|nr:ATP phosphoribosyltransferase [Bacteroidales bacterium]
MLRIAIQTKGRLNEQSSELLKDSGIVIDENKRKFIGKASNFPLEILYLRDDDIPHVISTGIADIGIVGMNEVREKGLKVNVIRELDFGHCRLSLAIPKAEEYDSLNYFNGKHIATSYPKILTDFLQQNNVSAVIHEITGSVEIAPAAGISDAIFDIVSSGGTLISNGLKEVEKVFFSEAVLISNPNMDEEKKDLLDELMFRFESVIESRGKKYLLMNIPTDSVSKAIEIIPAMRSPTVMPLALDGWSSLHSVVKEKDLWDKVKLLKQIGAEGILVLSVDKIIK